MNAVEVIVMNKQVATGPVVPYSHRQGLQLRTRPVCRRPVADNVPIYELRVTSGGGVNGEWDDFLADIGSSVAAHATR